MFGWHAQSCYDNKSQPKAEWWERKLGQVLTGNSAVWWVNIESAKSHLGHHLTSSAQRRSVLTVNKDILPTFCGINTGLWKQTATQPPHLPAITAPCERTLREDKTPSDMLASFSRGACGTSTSLREDGQRAESATSGAQEPRFMFVVKKEKERRGMLDWATFY